jgi:hypothetical protein
MSPSSQHDADAATKAERQTDIHFDFELEDIIAGNAPATDIGKALLAIVENGEVLPTQGKIEAALLPLYETMTADFYAREGGTAEPPAANRQSLKEIATKVIQARKVKRTARLRAARPPRAQAPAFPLTRFQLGAIAALIAIILLVVYLRS